MRKIGGVIGALCVSVSAFAQVTGLVTIPVADTKGVREVEIGYFATGTERNIDKGYVHMGYAILGVHEKVELAASTDFTGNSVWGFKVKLIDGPKGKYALSCGCQNVSAGHSDPYVVGRYDFEKFRLHAGWSRDEFSRFICGLDCPLSDNLTLAVDHWSGDGGSTWGGLFYSIPGVDGLSANMFVGLPNEHSAGIQHSVGIVYGFRF